MAGVRRRQTAPLQEHSEWLVLRGRSPSNPKFSHCVINVVGNYYKPGPATIPGEVSYRIVNSGSSSRGFAKWFVAENFMDGNAAITADNWDGGVQPGQGQPGVDKLRLMEPWPAMPIRPQSAEGAYRDVLRDAGATLPRREATYEGLGYKQDHLEIDQSKPPGIIDSPEDVGGWPELTSAPALRDSDDDGLPDAWEEKFGLDPRKTADPALDSDGDGYTDVEEYLNGTGPTEFIDYTRPENNRNTLR